MTPTAEPPPDPPPLSFTRAAARPLDALAGDDDDDDELLSGSAGGPVAEVGSGVGLAGSVDVAVADGGEVSGTVDATTTVVVAGAHVAAGSALHVGCGSFGFALPFGVHRQPSETDALTRVDGLAFEYTQPSAAVPCQYDQYA